MNERLYLQKIDMIRWKNGEYKAEEDYISIEEPLALEVNGQRVAVLLRLPGAEKELATGFLISEGMINDFNDIKMIVHCGSLMPGEVSSDPLTPSRNIVTVHAKQVNRPKDTATLLIRSGCGRTSVDEIVNQLPKVHSDIQIKIETLTKIAKEILDQQEVRKMAGGVHLAALFDAEGRMLVAYEDVGRHNAADKVIGYSLLNGIDLTDKILYNTGRASYELVTKGARMNIPIIASKSSPTSLAVEFARNTEITLCGFVRPNRVNIYSGEKRIIFTD